MKKLILFIFLLSLSGCGFVFQNLSQVQENGLAYGMSKEEVVAKMGQPQKISKVAIENSQYDVWEYPKERSSSTEMNALGTDYFKVFFLDGKLVQRDQDKVYGQPSYEYLESIDPQAAVAPDKTAEPKENLK